MKRLILYTLISLSTFSNIFSQDHNQTRQERKEEEKVKSEYKSAVTDSLLYSKNYVILANAIAMNGHTKTSVHPSFNFIKLNNNDIIIQRDYITEIISTFERPFFLKSGTIENYKLVHNNKRHTTTVSFDLQGQSIYLMVSENNEVIVKMDDSTWYGQLSSLNKADITERKFY